MIGSILASLFTLENFLVMNLGVAVGIIFGAIPGLSAVIGITLLLPITYSLSIIPSLCLLIGVYCGGVYGGSITAILIDTPGAPAAAISVRSRSFFPSSEIPQKGPAPKRQPLDCLFTGRKV